MANLLPVLIISFFFSFFCTIAELMLKTTDNYFIMLTYPLHLLTTDFVFSLQFLKDCAHKKCIFLYNSAQGLHMG